MAKQLNSEYLKKQLEFIMYLAQKYNIKNEQLLKSKINELGKQGIAKEYQEFELNLKAKEYQESELNLKNKARKVAHGAKLNYIKKISRKCADDEELVYFKKGGNIVDCGCVKKAKKGTEVTPKSWRAKFLKHRLGGSLNGVPFIRRGLEKVE